MTITRAGMLVSAFMLSAIMQGQPTTQQRSQQKAQTEPQEPTPPPTPEIAEDRMGTYTFWLTFFAGGTLLANLLLWWVTRGTLSHLRREFEAEHRPWIPADVRLASDWTWEAGGDGRVALQFTLRNVGHSPATNVAVHAEMFPLGWGFPSPADAQKRIAKSQRTGPIAPGEGLGMTIFPGDPPRPFVLSLPLGAADLEKSRAAFREVFPDVDPGLTVTPIIVGAIGYRFHGEKRQTGFIYQINRIDPKAPNAAFVLDKALGDTPLNLLRFTDIWLGSPVVE